MDLDGQDLVAVPERVGILRDLWGVGLRRRLLSEWPGKVPAAENTGCLGKNFGRRAGRRLKSQG